MVAILAGFLAFRNRFPLSREGNCYSVFKRRDSVIKGKESLELCGDWLSCFLLDICLEAASALLCGGHSSTFAEWKEVWCCTQEELEGSLRADSWF